MEEWKEYKLKDICLTNLNVENNGNFPILAFKRYFKYIRTKHFSTKEGGMCLWGIHSLILAFICLKKRNHLHDNTNRK